MVRLAKDCMDSSVKESFDFSVFSNKEEAKKERNDFSQQTFAKLRKVSFLHGGSRVVWTGYSEGRCVSLWKRCEDDVEVVDPFVELCRLPLEVDPSDICCFNSDSFCVSFTNGNISMYNSVNDEFSKEKEFHKIHGKGDARILCDFDGHSIISGSSNGSLARVDIESGNVTTFANGNSGVRSVCVLSGGAMIASGHSLGQLLIWDCRIDSFKPSMVCVPSKRRLDSVTAIANHSAQANLLSFGTDHGVVGFCDVRGVSHDLITNSYEAATSTISQVEFHPDCGDHLVCASADGSLVHWDVSGVNTKNISTGSRQSPWLSEALSQNVELDTLRAPSFGAVNSFAIKGTTVIAAVNMCLLYLYENVSFPIGTNLRH